MLQLFARLEQQGGHQINDHAGTLAHADFRFEGLVAAPVQKQLFRLAFDVFLQEVVVVPVAHAQEVVGEGFVRKLVLLKVDQHGAQRRRDVLVGVSGSS